MENMSSGKTRSIYGHYRMYCLLVLTERCMHCRNDKLIDDFVTTLAPTWVGCCMVTRAGRNLRAT